MEKMATALAVLIDWAASSWSAATHRSLSRNKLLSENKP
jgi:hypothetical protein